MAEADSGDDPFDGLELDEDFIRAAPRRELTAAERIERMGRIDADLRRRQHDRPMPAPAGSGSGRRWPRGWWVLALVLLAFAVWSIRRGTSSDEGLGSLTGGRHDVVTSDGAVTAYPPAPADLSSEPLGTPPAAPTSPGAFAFIAHQQGSDDPVAYDPCRRLSIVVNTRTEPAGSEGLVQEAIRDVARATGLRIVVDGTTDEAPSASRHPVQEERYGNRWAPALVAWSDPDESPDLAGDVAGLGGSQPLVAPSGDRVYVTGLVRLDGPQLGRVLAGPGGRAAAIGVIQHELGHLVGLDHVSDPTQLMAPEGHEGVTELGSGDRAGLARLGAGSCAPDL